MIIARIDYCNGLLYGVPAVNLFKLRRLQNPAARRTYNPHTQILSYYPSAACTLLWLPVKFRICYKIAVISFKAIHSLRPAYLSNLINIK